MRLHHALVLFLALPLFAGCVSKATHQQKIDEAAALERTIADLEGEAEGHLRRLGELSERNERLNQDLTDALSRNSGLQQDLGRARADIDRLEKVLSARSREAGEAMSEMRQSIDRLESENRELSRRVEEERLAREARIAQMKSTYDELVGKLESEIARGEVTISDLQGRLTVNMVDRILFDSGRADIKTAGFEVLSRVGAILKGVTGKEIRVEGHTDDVPISPRLKQTFPSNWELSTARAESVVHYLQETAGIDGGRLSACGFSEYRPIAGNDTAAGRAQNRRIQIVLVPIEATPPAPLERQE